jgi:hypothetical protein
MHGPILALWLLGDRTSRFLHWTVNAMSRLSTVSKFIILTVSIPTLALTSFNCYSDITAPDLGSPVFDMAPAATTEYTTVYVKAVVSGIHDNKSLFGGAISAGDTVSGFLVYDKTTQDSNADSTIGDYGFSMPPLGIKLVISGLNFRSNLDVVNTLLHLENDNAKQGTPYDYCSFISTRNMDVLPQVGVSRIQISLRDDAARALFSDKLLGTKPFLRQWLTTHSILIRGRQWRISANILSFSDGDEEVTQEASHPRKKDFYME